MVVPNGRSLSSWSPFSRMKRSIVPLFLLLALFAYMVPGIYALSHSNMKQPPSYGQQTDDPVPFETESHVIYGQDVSSTSSSSSSNSSASTNEGWVFETKGASWHVWTYRSLFDHVDLPLWPDVMDEARIVVSSEMCRDKHYLPPAPFMPPRGLEYCGIHVSATAKKEHLQSADRPDAYYSASLARAMMRRWVATFMGWPDEDNLGRDTDDSDTRMPQMALRNGAPGTDAFIGIGNASIYYFHPFASQLVDDRPNARLDLTKLAIGPHHPLRNFIDPHVMYQGDRWLDNHRIQVRLHRTHQGFVEIKIQVLSLLHPAQNITIVPAENATSSVTWIGPTKDTMAFTLTKNDPKPKIVNVPESFYAQHETANALAGGSVAVRTHEFCSFHPSLHISAHAFPHPHLAAGLCRIDAIQILPRSYFFDPYQLRDLQGGLGMNYTHYGPIELERPAETMPNWGSVLVVSQFPHLDTLDFMVPIHARYRLPVAHENTVGFHGEPTGSSHIDVSLLPPLAAVVCPLSDSQESQENRHFGSPILDDLDIRLALFHELGVAPVSALRVTPDSDTLLRMPVGKAEYASLVQILTLVALFLGTLFIALSLRKGKQAQPQQPTTAQAKTKTKVKI
ncbi:hypothetical protein IW140_004431 [Coemansia sp. RSA 1813]|nr:hypothetical protein EV178_005197 [Coemansia sp. RSA 1646]KAJ1770304.1 hypothetical protein LPJ74_003308 [Coemansia sp. RSA 1843]KAJ2087762.1 hypothetical protein IW138_004732 [Coemansia sp. RSA 986]KAJ2211835.1 hypothetical protein EV179_005166 [Coemansia sp. RSA 487]KAJ2567523.1 hypothetical protein IW140_004431 [Coemansia sp. RSA 1813]